MDYTYENLKNKTVAQLREIASGIDHEAIKGYTKLNKEHLLVALCKALNIDTFEHHEVVGVNKTAIKAKIKELKKKRNDALSAHNRAEFKSIIRNIRKLKRKIRKATV